MDYRQMSGRAGRMNQDAFGESIVCMYNNGKPCTNYEMKQIYDMMAQTLKPLTSALTTT
jgi:replicative superfamily II helicase